MVALATMALVAMLTVGLYLVAGRWDLMSIVLLITISHAYLFRLSALALGLDTPFPDHLFQGESSGLMLRTASYVTIYVVLLVGSYLVLSSRLPEIDVRATSSEPDAVVVQRIRLLVGGGLFGLALSLLITITFLVEFGSATAMIRASKVDKALAGTHFLRVIPAMTSLAFLASHFELRRLRKRMVVRARRAELLVLAGALLPAATIFLWGSRNQFLVVAIVYSIMVSSGSAARLRRSQRSKRATLLRLAGFGLAVLLLAYGLRILRDDSIGGGLLASEGRVNDTRAISVAANTTRLDGLMLALRDWPDRFPYRNGEDLEAMVVAPVPRLAWPGKPATVTTGTWFRQVYEPDVRNGWPITPLGEWYLNFGPMGVAAGALLGGVLLAFCRALLAHTVRSTTDLVFAAAVLINVVPLGFEVQTPARAVAWAVPAAAVLTWLRSRQVGAREHRRLDRGREFGTA